MNVFVTDNGVKKTTAFHEPDQACCVNNINLILLHVLDLKPITD